MVTDGSATIGQPARAGWTNASVRAFAEGADPLLAAASAARRLLEASVAAGVPAPPVDPFALAKLLGLRLRPANDVADAEILADPELGSQATPGGHRTAPLARFVLSDERLTIAYNPTRPRGRLRFSVAHEIAHALFPDVADVVRQRTPTGAVRPRLTAPSAIPGTASFLAEPTRSEAEETATALGRAELGTADTGDGWELELLCNVIAAELLMPAEAVAGLADIDTDIDFLMGVRRQWDISTEALLRRLIDVSRRPLTLVAASRVGDGPAAPMRVDYVVVGPASSAAAAPLVARGDRFPSGTILGKCTAVGQTVRGTLTVHGGDFSAQIVGIPGFLGARYPRVLALVEPARAPDDPDRSLAETSGSSTIEYRTGDLLDFDPSGDPLVIAHVVTDAARVWGRRGFAAALARKFPQAATAFRAWAIADPGHLALSQVHVCEQRVGTRAVRVASMVAQRGFGAGEITRLRYDALAAALDVIGALALETHSSVHVPRLGSGQAGGRWDMIEDLLHQHLVTRGVRVVVHTLPSPQHGTKGVR
jgi:hypothetical protein